MRLDFQPPVQHDPFAKMLLLAFVLRAPLANEGP
jgi:hypothetical protein